MKLCKRDFYASSHTAKRFLSCTYTPLYTQEKGHTFFRTMNSLVVQQHHQNVQMRSHNIMLNQFLAAVGVNVPLHIPDVPDVASLINISTTSTSDITHPPTYEHLHRHLLPGK